MKRVEHCFSEIESLSIYCKISQNILELLARTCKSIKRLRIINNQNVIIDNISGIIKLIEVQEKLNDGHGVPPDVLANLIESTKIHLSEISIYCVVFNVSGDKRLIQTIYQNCPNLRYLKLSLVFYDNSLISELDNLLINYNWKDRNPMLLKICTSMSLKEKQQLEDLIEPYKAKGIIKNYFIGFDGNISEKLEWI
uniref:F-box domain-containing protein n=1 Tax=Rhizophagus irregularis (strain DAOM 181602 / DAOM 197198 / MUCL 43194) TaxID=747089 RepID=U9UKB6_RHIID